MKHHKKLTHSTPRENTTSSVSAHVQLWLHPEWTYSWGIAGRQPRGVGPCRELVPLWGNLDTAPQLTMSSYTHLLNPSVKGLVTEAHCDSGHSSQKAREDDSHHQPRV